MASYLEESLNLLALETISQRRRDSAKIDGACAVLKIFNLTLAIPLPLEVPTLVPG